MCLLSHDDNVEYHCYNFSNYQFALIPEAVTQMEIMKVGEKLYVKEYYTGFYVLKIGNGMQKTISTNPTENFQNGINVITFRIPRNTFRSISKDPLSGRPLKSYIDYNDACDLIESPDTYIYDMYRLGCFFSGIPLASTEDGIVERIESNSNSNYLESVVQSNTIFSSDDRALIGKKFSNKSDYQIEMSQANLTVNVTGRYNHAIILDIDNPEKDVNLNVRTFDEGIIIQKSDGVTFNTKQNINGSIITESNFYSKHLIAIIEIWVSRNDRYQFNLPEEFYIRLQRPYKKCVRRA
ncbi:unnamed protein product [Gordionus sp. m RMFG-2023]